MQDVPALVWDFEWNPSNFTPRASALKQASVVREICLGRDHQHRPVLVVGTTNTDLRTTDARFSTEALGEVGQIQFKGPHQGRDILHEGFPRDPPVLRLVVRTPATPPTVRATFCVYEHYKYA